MSPLARRFSSGELAPPFRGVSSETFVATDGPAPAASPTSGRLQEIEGLRAYLAMWVVVGHVLWIAGFQKEDLSGIPLLLRSPEMAVDVFIIVSGFVIFLALDTKRDGYLPFIVRRFFRLFPSFILLFLVSIPISAISMWNATHASFYQSPADVHYDRMITWWQNLHWHVPAHFTMLHGLVPRAALPEAPNAFLIAAWSVSLEWQFYLVAPLVFACISNPGWRLRVVLASICLLTWMFDYGDFAGVESSAALPFNFAFFLVGGASHLAYEQRSKLGRPYAGLVLAFGASVPAYLVRTFTPIHLIPTVLWLMFLGSILEPTESPARRALSPLLTHRAVLYLGRISYGVYLSHMLVISCVQYTLLRLASELGQTGHFALLLVATIAITIPLSIGLHRYVEVPSIALGRSWAERLRRSRGRVESSTRSGNTAFRPARSPDLSMSAGRTRE